MKNSGSKVVIVVLVVIIAILLIAFLNTKTNPEATEVNEHSTSTQTSTPSNETEPNTAKSFDAISPSDWKYTQKAEEAIQSLAPGQKINFSIIEDPTNTDLAYFVASVYDGKAKEMLLSVYEYNTADYSWERLFRSSYAAGEFPGMEDFVVPQMHVLGYDSGNLIILVQDVDDSPGPCAQPILLTQSGGDTVVHNGEEVVSRRLVSMSLENPYNALKDYSPDGDLLAQAESTQESCLRDLQ